VAIVLMQPTLVQVRGRDLMGRDMNAGVRGRPVLSVICPDAPTCRATSQSSGVDATEPLAAARGTAHAQTRADLRDAPPLAIPLQFEVNHLNGNLIALSFIFTYLPTCSSRGMISTGCHAQHRNIYCNQLLPDEG
jgi:hypothetical protein